MTQDAREALARVSTSFRALYRAYTGEEPDPQKTAPAAAAGAAPAADWKRSYDAVNASLTSMIGGGTAAASAGTGQVGTAGTSGSTAATGMQALTQEVRADLTLLRDQLTRFFRAAGGESANGSAPAEDPRR